MANLIYMCKEMSMKEKEEHYTKLLNSIYERDASKIETARSLAEQGYIMMIDLHSETREGPEKTASALKDQVVEQTKFCRSAIERSNFEDILKHVNVIQKKLHCAQNSCHRETTQEKREAMSKLKQAISMLKQAASSSLRKEVNIWRHYLGKAYIRISGGSNEITSRLLKKIYIKNALEILTDVAVKLDVEGSDDKERLILARTYAYIAYICQLNGHILKEEAEIQKLHIKDVLICQNPLSIAEKADAICSKIPDRVVLNKLGRIYMLGGDWNKAAAYLKKSIQICDSFNWFAYSWLCKLYLDKHSKSIDEKSKRTGVTIAPTNDLHEAKEYGMQCLKMRRTSLTLFRVAQVCRYMGKLTEAIGYLQTALSSHECERHPDLYALLANCWYETGEFQSAVHVMKIAITIEKKQKDPLNFKNFLTYLLEGFRRGMVAQKSQRDRQLQEICCVVEEGYRKHGKRIKYQLVGVINKYPHETIEVVDMLLKSKWTEKKKEIIDMCIKALDHHNGIKVIKRTEILKDKKAKVEQSACPPETEQSACSAEIDQPEIIYDRKMSRKRESVDSIPFEFDFYVLFPPSESVWVDSIFLGIVENDFNKKEKVLSGLIWKSKDRASDICKKCRRFIFVITKEFTRNAKVRSFANEIRRHCIEGNQDKDGRIIPILREEIELPDFLNTLTSCHADDIFRIKNAIVGLNDWGEEEDDEEGHINEGEDIAEANSNEPKSDDDVSGMDDDNGDIEENVEIAATNDETVRA